MDSAKYLNTAASVQVKAGGGQVYGIIVNSHSSGTVKLWDSLTAANDIIVNTYSYPSGSQVVMFPTPIDFYTGLYYTEGGTADVTIIYK